MTETSGPCKCPSRLRRALRESGYRLQRDLSWLNLETGDRIPDTEIERHHLRIVAMRPSLWPAAIKTVLDPEA